VGTFADITVLGFVIGGGGQDSGIISSLTDVGVVDIGQGLIGGGGEDSGEINTFGGNIAGVIIGGSIVGGSGADSGEIDNLGGSILAVSIGGSVLGSSGTRSGEIDTVGGNIGQVTIGGSLIGGSLIGGSLIGGSLIGGSLLDAAGTATGTGAIIAGGSLGAVTIGVNLVGGSIAGSNVINLAQSGYITGTHIESVTVGGSLISGSNTNTGTGSTLTQDGSIRASQDIGSITVNGNLTGNTTNPVIISAVGQAVVPAKASADVAIGQLTVGGRVELANILAGYDPATNGVANGTTAITEAVNGEASIGKVKVKGDWLQSNLVAGVEPGADNFFGTADDTEIGTETTEDLVARIASIHIGGQALGTPGATSGTDHFGFVAEEVAAFSLGGTTYKLKKGPSNDGPRAIGTTGDLTLFEVP